MRHRHNFFDILAALFGRSTKDRDDAIDELRDDVRELRKELADRPTTVINNPAPIFAPYMWRANTYDFTAVDHSPVNDYTITCQSTDRSNGVNIVNTAFRIVDDDDDECAGAVANVG